MKSKASKIAAGLIALALVVAVAIPMFSMNSSAAFDKSQYSVTDEITDYDAMDIQTILESEESLTWVFAGDSITHNGQWAQGMNGYAEWFEQYLYDINRNNDSVINTAWGGADILDFQTAENEGSSNGTASDKGMGIYNFITKYSPDVVFIKLGMNDRDQTTANFKTRYETMLTSLYDISYNTHKKIPKVVVIAPTPVSSENVYDDMWDPEQNLNSSSAGAEHYDSTLRVRDTLEDIVADCNAGGYKVLFSDLRSGFLDKAVEIGDDYHHMFFTDPSDGIIHPNAAGQYLMFNLLSETLGIRDEKMPIYQIAYEEFENAALYTGEFSALEVYEMNKTAPTLDGVTPLANVDFDSSNGVYNGAGIAGLDMTSELTQTEAASLQDAFTVVIRAQFPEANSNNQSVVFISSDGTDNWNNALTLGIPGDKAELYYSFRSGDAAKAKKMGAIAVSGGTYDNDNLWHTIVVSYDAGTVKYYKDGQLLTTATGYGLADGVTSIGSMFTDSTNYAVQLGRYGFKEDATAYALNAKMDFWQFYGTALTDAQVLELSGNKSDYSDVLTENSVWVVAGAEQMSGYEGPVANRSMLRLFDNALRNPTALRDLRIVSAAAPGNTPAYLDANFDALIGEHITAASTTAGNNTVFMMLPEIPEVYDANYDASTIDTQVSAYKGYVESLIGKSTANIEILWTPLASNDATINGYLAKYAEAVREVAAANDGVLLFDAYAYMNAYMAADSTVARNWFDNNGYISPLGATDVTYAFINEMGLSSITTSELTGHNLRYASDVRTFKGNYIRDYYETVATVSGETVTLDVSTIVNAGYTLDTSSVALLPEAGTGNYNENIIWLKDVASDLAYANNKFTFTAPCSDLDIAIYSEKDGKIYRFKDVDLTVDTDNVIDTTPNPTSAVLDSLEIVGVPAVDLATGDTFDVTLYQYQKYPQVRATAQDGLKITVTYTDKDGKEVSEVVESGKNSGLIPEEVETVKVTVSGTVSGSAAEKTYTLNLTRPDYPDIIITEVMQDGYWGYDVKNYDNYELVEIYNASGKDLNLLDYSLGWKKDYPSDLITETNGEWPYYFTGNNQAFNGAALYTGVNQITKYSSYWINDGTVTEPKEVNFPADSTMVIWVKEASADLTFDTLRKALEENAFVNEQKTLTVNIDGAEKAVVPTEGQLVVAEIPEGAAKGGQSNRATVAAANSIKNFYMDNFGSAAAEATTRGWLFLLGNDAVPATNGAISEAGDDIVSASKFVRIADTSSPDRLSSVFSYNVERGMSLVKDEASWDDQYNVGHTSDEQGYSNLTSFGAIEYWQKPADLDDETAPTIVSKGALYNVDTETAAVNVSISDDNDIRFIELNVKDADGNVTTIKKDLVLEKGVETGGVSTDITAYDYTYSVANTDESSKLSFWGYVEDGNGNVTEFGAEDEEVSVCETQTVEFTAEEAMAHMQNGTHPTLDGRLFAGWYTNAACNTDEAAVRSKDAELSGKVYALFVPEHVLSVKAQLSTNLYDGVTADETGNIRFVTTVDSLRYREVGFKITFDKGSGEKTYTKASNKVYTQLYSEDGSGEIASHTPQGLFCDVSEYFKACTVTGVGIDYFGMEFKVTPYWITLDGITIEGVSTVKTINQGLPKDLVYVSQTIEGAADEPGYGTETNPYATLEYALANVNTPGTICIIGDYTVPADFVWKAHNKNVTVTNSADETLDFSALSELSVNDAVKFESINLTLPKTVYAEGYDFEIAGAGQKVIDGETQEISASTVTNTDTTIYGGSNSFEVAKTNIKLYAGTYAAIYGGSSGKDVAGNTNVTIGGNVNGAIDFENHSGTNNLYGGSLNGTVSGDTNVTVEADTARFNYVYGAGYGSKAVVEGSTNVTFAGKAMCIYGGSHTGTNSDTHVTMTGGYVEQIFGGSYKNSMTGDTDVRVMGGEVKRRIYAGCYNNFVTDGTSGTWEDTKYHVTGHTSVTVGPDANLSLDYSETVAFISLKADTTLMAASRWSETFADEWGVMIFTEDSYSSNSSKIGYNGDTHSSYFSTQDYNYLVKASTGGTVYSEGDALYIVPNDGNVAIVEVGGAQVHYAEGETRYVLPALDSETATEEIIVKFSTETQNTSNYEARIDGGYFETIEEAFEVVDANYAATVEILKDTVDVATTLDVADSENVTVKNAEGVNAMVYRADALVNGNIFDVAAGGNLTIEGITLDGRTPAEITAGTTDLASLTGSTASLINTAGEVHVNNVIAQYAVKTEGFGAVLYGEGVATAVATVDGSEFKYNKSADQGGAICMYAHSGNLEVSNSIFTNNQSDKNGGAISAHAAKTTVTNCKFTGNTSGANGGAFYSGTSNKVTMTTTADASVEALFSGNSAKEGGAVGIGSGSNTISGYTFKTNTATSQGGALQNSASTYTLTSCYFEGNSAPWGGAIINYNSGKLILTTDENATVESMFKANTTTGNGGAICLNSGSISVEGYTFDGNTAEANGGAIRFNNAAITAEFTDTSFVNNTAGARGGAIDNNSSNASTLFTFVNTDGTAKFDNNTAGAAAGAMYNAGPMNIVGYTFSNNTAGGIGGAINNAGNGANATIVNTKFESNEATGNSYGGAIANTGSAKMKLMATSQEFGVTEATLATFEGNISNNTATGFGGGAVYFGSGSFSIDGYALNNNISKGDAGALCLRGTSTVTNCTFDGNDADQVGGAIYCFSKATITGSTFTNNTAVGATTTTDDEGVTTTTNTGGGAIHNIASGTTIKTSSFSGNTSEQDGGAIYTSNNMTISDSSFTSNVASVYGGAVRTAGGTTTVTDTTFTTNESPRNGGAINNTATLKLVGTKETALFDRNKTTATGRTDVYGGAVYNSGTMTAEKYTFTGNYNVYRGGAIGNYGKNPTITDCKFVGNYAPGNGGAIYSGGGVTINLVATGTSELAVFDGNYASAGTGGGAVSMGSGTLHVTGYKFINNYAPNGGAIYNSSNVKATITGIKGDKIGSLFQGNYSTTSNGGAINLASGCTLELSDYVFNQNEAKTTEGGAIYGSKATLNVTDTKFTGNIAKTHAGAIYSAGGCTVTITGTGSDNAIMQGNSAGSDGGAMYIGNGTLTVDGYTFTGNHATNGGAIRHNNQSSSVIKNSTFSENYSEANGGAIYTRASHMQISETDFTDNYTVEGNGGAIYQARNKVTLTSTSGEAVFSGNKAQGTDMAGGAICVEPEIDSAANVTCTLNGSGYTFTENTATIGGAVYLVNVETGTDYTSTATVNLTGCTFGEESLGNTATTYGGAIYVDSGATLTATDTAFVANSAPVGGAINCYGSTLTATSCNFTKNLSTTTSTSGALGKGGGAVNVVGKSTATFDGAGTFTQNDAERWGGAIYTTDSVLTVDGYTFDQNYALHAAAILFDGAAEDSENVESSVMEVKNSVFTRNESVNAGGAFYINVRSVKFTDCTFGGTDANGNSLGNKTTGSSKTGGVIHLGSGSAEFVGTDSSKAIFEYNSATGNGGAICNGGGTVTVKGYTFVKNSSGWEGGAIYNGANGKYVTMTDCKFGGAKDEHGQSLGNTSVEKGGAVYVGVSGKLLFNVSENPTVEAVFEGNTAGLWGGAIALGSGTLEVYGYKFLNNTADNGGAIARQSGTTITIADSENSIVDAVFEGNTAKKDATDASGGVGGAIYTTNGITNITGYTFINNSSESNGGALGLNGGTVVANDCTFGGYDENDESLGNHADANGGAAYCGNSGTLKFIGTGSAMALCQGNTADGNGGAIAVGSGTLTVEKYTFDGNSAIYGGAVRINDSKINSTFTDVVFINNSATTQGGAIHNNIGSNTGYTMTIENCTFGGTDAEGNSLGNTAPTAGAIGLNTTIVTTITNSSFIGNSATKNYGGAIWTFGDVILNTTSFMSNTAATNGGAICMESDANVTVNAGSTFSGNTPQDIYNNGTGTLTGYTTE